MEALLRVASLSVTYGRIAALRNFSLELRAADVVAIVGPNGAGKTSVLRAIAGFLAGEPVSVRGQIAFAGRPISSMPPFRRAHAGIALVAERDKVFPGLTVGEHLALADAGHSAQIRAIQERCLTLFPRLAGLMQRRAGMLSGGERQMLALTCAFMAQPRLLLVDELSQGLAPGVVTALADALRVLQREQHCAMLVVEQNPALAAELADRLVILDGGECVAAGPARELVAAGALASAYLGLRDDWQP